MRLDELRLINFCQHRDRTIKFGPGLNCLVGPIGAGKSNILNGLTGALTNNFRRVPGVKNDNIRKTAGKDEPAGVSLRFWQGNEEFTLERWLQKPAGQEYTQLLAGLQLRLTKDSAIREALQSILGVSEEVLEEYVFVKQWGIFSLLAATPETRAKSLQQLFGTAFAEKVWDILGSVKLPQGVVLTGAAEAEAVRVAAQSKAEELRQQLAALVLPPEGWAQLIQQDYAVLHAVKEAERLEQERQSLDLRLSSCRLTMSQLKMQKDKLQQEHSDIELWLQEQAETSGQAREALHQAEAAARLSWARKRDEAELSAAQNLLEVSTRQLQEPLPSDYLQESYSSQLLAMREHQVKRQAFMRQFGPESHTVQCPTCGTAADNLRPLYEQYKEEYPGNQATLELWEAAWTRSRELDRRRQTLRQSQQEAERVVTRLQEALASMPVIATVEVAAAKAYLQQEQDRLKRQQQLAVELAKLEATEVGLTRDVQHAESQLSETRRKQSQLATSLPVERVVEAQARVLRAEEWRAAEQQRATLAAMLQEQERALEAARKALVLANKIQKENQAKQLLASHLEEVRAVFHRNNLPRLIAETKFEAMLDDINDMLQQFELPFTAELGEGLQLLADFGKYKQPVVRLSGGQMVLFAIALRIAVYRLAAADIGLLCLDEPTAGLAQTDTRCLGAAFAKLRDLSKSTGLQVILVTHDPALASQCDRIIEIEGS